MPRGQGAAIPINERADEMMEYLGSDDVIYSDLESEFDEYVAYLAIERGPSAEVDEDNRVVEVSEADIAIASFLGEKKAEAEDWGVKAALEGGVSGLGTLGAIERLVATGDPGWFVGGLLTGYYSKLKAEEIYEDLRELRKYRRERSESLEELREDYPDIGSFRVEMKDLDDGESSVRVVRPDERSGIEPEGIGFQ